MAQKNDVGVEPWIDPDDAPELTEEWFRNADIYEGARLIRRGAASLAHAAALGAVALDPDVLERLRATGPDWQARANDALRDWLDNRPNP